MCVNLSECACVNCVSGCVSKRQNVSEFECVGACVLRILECVCVYD